MQRYYSLDVKKEKIKENNAKVCRKDVNMINSKSDLKRYLEMDRIALGCTRKKPKIFGDEIWKFEIILRKHEYYTNCSKNIFQKIMKKYYHLRHHYMGLWLGFEIPCNIFGGYVSTITD